MNRIKELYEQSSKFLNVHPLFTDEVFMNRGVVFAGNPMWYPLETPKQKDFFYNSSNDSRLIKGFDIQQTHLESLECYTSLLNKKVDVMISHVPVIHLKSHKTHGGIECYYTQVDEINVKHWVFGHSHERGVYKQAAVNFYINSIG